MRWTLVTLAIGIGMLPQLAAAQTELLTVMPGPGPSARVVVRRAGAGSATRTSVDAWIVPSNGSGESPNVSVGTVAGTRHPARRTFTLVSTTGACVVRSTEDVELFAGMTASGDRLEASILPAVPCADATGALAGSHSGARLVALARDPSAAARLPTPLPASAEHQTPLTAPGLPFVVLGGTDLSIGVAFAFCRGRLLAQRPAYAGSLLTLGDATFLVAQPVAFADGALWRSELVPLVCAPAP